VEAKHRQLDRCDVSPHHANCLSFGQQLSNDVNELLLWTGNVLALMHESAELGAVLVAFEGNQSGAA
jgi:hypothetical protein